MLANHMYITWFKRQLQGLWAHTVLKLEKIIVGEQRWVKKEIFLFPYTKVFKKGTEFKRCAKIF